MSAALFSNREEAGCRLGAALEQYRDRRLVVVAIPRNGVPVALQVARTLDAPLAVYEGARSASLDIDARVAILVDDGTSDEETLAVVGRALRGIGAAEVVLAVPVGPPATTRRLAHEFDDVVCLEEPDGFREVDEFYTEFDEVSDGDVLRCLAAAPKAKPPAGAANASGPHRRVAERGVSIEVGTRINVLGDLRVPRLPKGLVLFAHGSGSSRHSPRNKRVAETLNDSGFATLLFDLLTQEEESDRANVFDIPLLALRLVAATRWTQSDSELKHLPLGYFGASTGAGAALRAAAEVGQRVKAVVSRGGRPDLAGASLRHVTSPTLLIVGGADRQVLALNEEAAAVMSRCEHAVAVVPEAGHLFEEPGALDRAAQLAVEWFQRFASLEAVRPLDRTGR